MYKTQPLQSAGGGDFVVWCIFFFLNPQFHTMPFREPEAINLSFHSRSTLVTNTIVCVQFSISTFYNLSSPFLQYIHSAGIIHRVGI